MGFAHKVVSGEHQTKQTRAPVKGLYYATWYAKSYADVWESSVTIRGLFFKHHCEWHGWNRICSATAFMVFHRTGKMGFSPLKVESCNLRYQLGECIWHHLTKWSKWRIILAERLPSLRGWKLPDLGRQYRKTFSEHWPTWWMVSLHTNGRNPTIKTDNGWGILEYIYNYVYIYIGMPGLPLFYGFYGYFASPGPSTAIQGWWSMARIFFRRPCGSLRGNLGWPRTSED